MAKRKATATSDESVAPATKKTSAKKLHWFVTAKRNARLPDGTLVSAGKRVKVSREYVERLRASNDQTFEISQSAD